MTHIDAGTEKVPPILKYPGAKWRLASWILESLPVHKSYLEPYFGSGAVFFQKPKSQYETINDMDGEVVNFFKMCREHPRQLSQALALTPWAREEREEAFDDGGELSDIEKARRFAVRCWMTFGGFRYRSNGWRHTTGKGRNGGPDNPGLWNQLPDRVVQVATRLKDAQIENRPALEVIKGHNGSEVLIYADPPYMHSTRTAHAHAYRFEMTDSEHEALLNALLDHQGMVVLSGYENSLYRDMLQGWAVREKVTQAECAARRTECLWVNPQAMENIRANPPPGFAQAFYRANR